MPFLPPNQQRHSTEGKLCSSGDANNETDTAAEIQQSGLGLYCYE